MKRTKMNILKRFYYKISAFAFTLITANKVLEGFDLISPYGLFVIIFGLGFYLSIVELIEEYL